MSKLNHSKVEKYVLFNYYGSQQVIRRTIQWTDGRTYTMGGWHFATKNKTKIIQIRGKTLVHEFAKLRWGVFEEHGYPGDAKFPMYYMKAVWSPSGQNTVVTPNFCINGELRGYEQVAGYVLRGVQIIFFSWGSNFFFAREACTKFSYRIS